MANRKAADCRLYLSEKNCSLYISGTEKEVMDASIQHAVSAHGHKDTPKFRAELKKFLKDAKD